MCQKHIKFSKTLTTPIVNDSADSHCSRCSESTPSILDFSKITRRNCACHLKRSVKRVSFTNIMFHKFLLIYVLVFIAFSPLIMCMRHQELPNDSVSIQITPSTNSIDTRAILNAKSDSSFDDDSDNFEEESEEDFMPSSEEVRKEYEKQFQAHSKNISLNNDKQNSHLTTMKPTRTSVEGSCMSTACVARKDIEKANTETIRSHILWKLGMEHEPNQTKYPKLTREYREFMCKQMSISPESCFGKKIPNVEYQSDDPIDSHYDDSDSDRGVVTEEEDVQFLSFENRIYAFPSTAIKSRHKSHLVFQFTDTQQMNNAVSHAVLNLYVHSKNFLRSSDTSLPKSLQFIDIEIAKVLQGSQHKIIFETFRNISIPDVTNKDGQFVQLNITDMVAEWFSSHETAHGMAVKIIASKSGAPMPHKIVSLDAENFTTRPFIDILPRDQRKKRTKRSSLRCARGSTESRCCRHELTVDFEKFGWDWVIAPKRYDANYCAGECKIAFMQQFAHTHVMQLSTAANPCCSPRKMTSMQLLYFDSQLNIVLGTIPNMIVEECFCS